VLDPAAAAELAGGNLTGDLAAAVDFAERAKADNTRRGYAADLADLEAYLLARDQPLQLLPLPPAAIGAYLSACARLRPAPRLATLARRLAAIRTLHQATGHVGLDNPGQHPDLLRVWRGIRRERTWSQRQAAPAATAEVRRMVQACPPHLYIGVRDRAMLLLGYALLTRRSELVRLDIEDLVLVDQGLVVTVWRRKTDPEGKDVQLVAVPYGQHLETCPVRAWLAWREVAGLATGPAFRPVHPRARLDSPDTAALQADIQAAPRLRAEKVSEAIKRAAARAELPDPQTYSGHSPRRGAAVELRRRAHATDIEIAEAGGWRNPDQVRRYTKLAALWDDPPAGWLGL
jgi:integrase